MQKTDRLTKVVSLLLFLALAAYIGFYLVGSFLNPLQTSPAVRTTIVESGRSEGIIVRSELVIESSLPNIDISAAEGQRVATGATIAMSHSNEEGLRRADRIRELKLEISRTETILAGVQSGEDLLARESAVQNALFSLCSAVARGEMENLDSLELNLRSLILGEAAGDEAQGDLDALKAELDEVLRSTLLSGDATAITATAAGTFTSVLDGYESLSPQALEGLRPSSLGELISQRGETPVGAFGKLITSQKWYYAAKITDEDASRLQEGDIVEVDFGRHYDKILSFRVESVSPPEEGESAVLFSCGEGLADTSSLRLVTAEIKFAEFSGLRVPAEALRVDEDGTRFVYVVTAMVAEKKPVEIIYEEGGYFLAATDPKPGGLRENNEIIVKARGLYDGKVLR